MTQYRALGNEELLRDGDECRYLSKTEWKKVDLWPTEERTPRSLPEYSFRRRIHRKGSAKKKEIEKVLSVDGYRLLDIGEEIKEGDEWSNHNGKIWDLTVLAGDKYKRFPNQIYRRKMDSSEGLTFLNELKTLIEKYKDTPEVVAPLYKQLVATLTLVGENV
jgi:hypothetical protein